MLDDKRNAPKVLIVDDEQGARKLVALILSDTYRVETVDSVARAMASVEAERPWIIITDIKMPGEDGLALLTKIKKESPRVPVILMTGHGDKELAIRAIKEGAFDLLEKPFGEQELRLAVRRASDYADVLHLNQQMLEQLSGRNGELERLNQQIINSQNQLMAAKRLAYLGQMATSISYEVSTPLNVVHGLTEMLLILADDHPIRKDMIVKTSRDIGISVRHVATSLRGLRMISRDASSDPFTLINVRELLTTAVEFCRPRCEQHGIKLQLDEIPQNLQFECRHDQIFQGVVGLINRSYEALAENFEKWIRVDCEDHGDMIHVRVSDSSPQLPKAVRDNLFAANPMESESTWGLNFYKTMIDAHNGEFTLRSDLPETCFEFHLPKKQSVVKSA